jgi:Pyruvate/2-oxoacid:ferredoxin oxidoreductase delta subunit
MPRALLCQIIGDRRVRPDLPAAEKRLKGFAEAEPTFTLEQAMAEATRCAKATPCLYCEVCELLCPDLAITRDPETRRIRIDLDYCKGCHLCAIYCPHGAIEMVLDE